MHVVDIFCIHCAFEDNLLLTVANPMMLGFALKAKFMALTLTLMLKA